MYSVCVRFIHLNGANKVEVEALLPLLLLMSFKKQKANCGDKHKEIRTEEKRL